MAPQTFPRLFRRWELFVKVKVNGGYKLQDVGKGFSGLVFSHGGRLEAFGILSWLRTRILNGSSERGPTEAW